jgi:hypothetical protein
VKRRHRPGWFWIFAAALVVVAVVVAGTTGRLSPVLEPAWRALSAVQSPADAGDAAPAPDASFVPHKQAAPLSSAQLGAPLVRGEFVSACNAPATMKVVVKVTVQKGRATEANVATDPPDTAVSRCIDDAIHQLQWDISPKQQQLTVRY